MKRLLVVLGVAGVSLSAVFVRWSTAPSLVLALYRMAFSAALLAPYALLRHGRELAALSRREVLLCLASGACLGLHFAAYCESLRWTSIASSVVLVDTEVLFVALGTVTVLGRRLPGKAWLAVALAFGGSVVIALADTAAGPDALRGDLIALFGAACMAAYTLIGAFCRKHVSTTAYTFLVYVSAAVTVLLAAYSTQGQMRTVELLAAGNGPADGQTAIRFSLPEDTTLQRNMKTYLLSGGKVGTARGRLKRNFQE